MEKLLDFIKDNITKIIVTIVIAIMVIVGICIYIKQQDKKYSLVEIKEYKYYLLNKNEKYGVIDNAGNIILDSIYDNIKIPNPEKEVFICEKDGKYIVLNSSNQQIFTDYEEVTAISTMGTISNIPYEKGVLRYKKNGKYGLINYEGKKITNPVYEEINGLENKESELIVKKNGKYGVINSKGARLIKTEYDNIVADGYYEEGNKYAKSGYILTNKTKNGYRYGYISYKLKPILDIEYNEITRIQNIEDKNNIYLIASKNGKYGVQKDNKVLINFSYQGIEYSCDNKLFEIQRNSKFGVFDIFGNNIIPIEYDEIEEKGVYLQAIKGEEMTIFNVLGSKIEDSKYTSLIKISENYYISVNEEGFYGIIDKQEKEIIQNKYNYLEYLFGQYFIASNSEGNLGIIDIKDNKIVDFKYDVLQKVGDTSVVEGKILKENISELYSENLEKISSDEKVAVYKEDEHIVVYSSNGNKYFDLKGNELTARNIFSNNKLFAINKDGKWGYENKNGELVVNCEYDRVTEFNAFGFAGIKQENKWGIINDEGKVIVEPIYKIQEGNSDPEFLKEYYKVYYGYGEIYYTNNVNE